MRKNQALMLFVFVGLFMMLSFISSVSADVSESWDWHNVTVGGESKHKRWVHWCWDNSVSKDQKKEWSNWMYLAAQNWNRANTGWTISYTDDPTKCQIVIKFADLKRKPAGQSPPVAVEEDENSDYWLKKGGITFDSDPSNNVEKPAPGGWGTTGSDTYDPVVVAKHEFGHYLRLDHTTGADDKMNVGDPGYHNHTLSAEDIQEAKDSAGSIGKPITRIDCIFSDYKLNCSSDENDSISTLEGTFAEPTRVKLFSISDWTAPERNNVPQGYGYIARAFRLHVGDAESVNLLEVDETERSFNMPLRVTVSYTGQDIGGGEVECLNVTRSPLLESELNAFVYDFSTSSWDIIPGSILDIQRNTVTFETYQPGIFGIGGPEKVGEEFEYLVLFEEAYVQIIQFPMASLMIGNERINLYVDGEVQGHLVTENNEVVCIGMEDLEDPTLNVHISEGTIEALVDGEITFVEAFEDDKIRFEGVGFFNSLKLGASSAIFNIYSFFSDLL